MRNLNKKRLESETEISISGYDNTNDVVWEQLQRLAASADAVHVVC